MRKLILAASWWHTLSQVDIGFNKHKHPWRRAWG